MIMSNISRLDMEQLSRKEAIAVSATKYFTGKPCHKGHLSYRYTASGLCAACQSEKAKVAWALGHRQPKLQREKAIKNWNTSNKAKVAKQRWKEANPKRAWASYAVSTAKMRAALKNIPFDVDTDYIVSIAPDACPVFSTPFSFVNNGAMMPTSPSLDRISPEKGYVRGNVVVVSVKANAIKNAYGAQEIQAVANWLRQLEI